MNKPQIVDPVQILRDFFRSLPDKDWSAVYQKAESLGIEEPQAWRIYQEEWAAYRTSPERRAKLHASARVNIYAGIALHLIPPIGMILLGIGIADELEARGYGRTGGILGAFSVFGLAIALICCSDRYKENNNAKKHIGT